VQFGGEEGTVVTARAGDVVVLPAGTAHKKLAARGALGIVGAYPEASRPDTHRGTPAKDFFAELPACDPVHGAGGPLFTYWLRPSGR